MKYVPRPASSPVNMFMPATSTASCPSASHGGSTGGIAGSFTHCEYTPSQGHDSVRARSSSCSISSSFRVSAMYSRVLPSSRRSASKSGRGCRLFWFST